MLGNTSDPEGFSPTERNLPMRVLVIEDDAETSNYIAK